jgi:uncharacterized membrane protein YphA (DoxX/SURF4 family)
MTTPATPTPVEMSHPSRWLAVLRIAYGFWFFKALWSKLDVVLYGGFFPWLGTEQRWIDVMPTIIARQMAENPIPWYKAFVETTVLQDPATFARLTAWGETLVGISLVFGLFAGLGALGALFLSIMYALATWHMSASSEGFHYLLITTAIVLFLARSGRAWGLDGWLAWRWPGSWITRRPFA